MITIQWLRDFTVVAPTGEVVRDFKRDEKTNVTIRRTGMWTSEGQIIKGIRQGEDFVFLASYAS